MFGSAADRGSDILALSCSAGSFFGSLTSKDTERVSDAVLFFVGRTFAGCPTTAVRATAGCGFTRRLLALSSFAVVAVTLAVTGGIVSQARPGFPPPISLEKRSAVIERILLRFLSLRLFH